MNIRPIKKKEILTASNIVRKNYSKRYERNSKYELLEMFGNALIKPEYIVAEEKGKIIGFAGYIQSFMDYHVYQIFWVNVEPENQGKGVGTELIREVINRIKKIKGIDKQPLLIQLTTTKPNFYEKKFKFKKVAKIKDKDYLMVLKLN